MLSAAALIIPIAPTAEMTDKMAYYTMKTIISAFVIAVLLLALCDFAICEESERGGRRGPVMSDGSIYSYDENDAPAVFFFPKEKARWDGAMVSMREWYMLTELQKEKFINEYLQQLQGRYKTSIDVIGVDYLKALNIFSSYSNDKTLSEPSTKFVDILLSGQGKLTEKGQLKNGN